MTAPGVQVEGQELPVAHPFDIAATFVPAGAEHRFVGYEELAVLVIFERGRR